MSYLIIFIPFLALILLNLFRKEVREKAAFWVCCIVLALQIIIAALSPFNVWSIRKMEAVLHFGLWLDGFSLFLIVTLAIIGLVALLVGHFTIKDEHARFNFKNLLLVAVIGMNGIAMVTDLFSLYVFIEVTALATFILLTLYKDRYAFEGAVKYLILSVVASVLMLSAIALALILGRGTSFAALAASPAALALFVAGLFIKGGLVPFHGWVADAYTAAPAAVSVFLAGIVTKAAGIFALIRIFSIIGLSGPMKEVLLVFGMLSILVGALVALGQKDMKRMLAYSSISQVGYIVVALGAGTQLGILAAIFHFFNHAIFKSQLFANAAAVEEQLGHRDMEKMGGLAQVMPVTGTTSLIASLSTAGVPPLAGFWSKLMIIVSLWLAGLYFYALVAILASVLTLGYFLILQRMAFFGKVPPELAGVKEVSAGFLFPVVVLSSITVMIGLLFPLLMFFAR